MRMASSAFGCSILGAFGLSSQGSMAIVAPPGVVMTQAACPHQVAVVPPAAVGAADGAAAAGAAGLAAAAGAGAEAGAAGFGASAAKAGGGDSAPRAIRVIDTFDTRIMDLSFSGIIFSGT